MPFVAPKLLSHERAAVSLSASIGALVLAPAGPLAAAISGAICGAACVLARPARARDAHEAARRAAMCFALLAATAGAFVVAADVAHRGPTVVLMALGVYACDLPFYGFLAYVVGAIFVGPLAREGHRLVRRPSHDGWQRLVTTAALVGTLALLPSLAGASRDDDLAAVSALAFGLTWLACLWVLSTYVSSHRFVRRIREGRLAGYRVRGPATIAERRALPPLFSEYGDEEPMDALVRLDEVRAGAYREAPLEEPIALVPAPRARVTRTGPALLAVVVPTAQALLLLLAWSVLGN